MVGQFYTRVPPGGRLEPQLPSPRGSGRNKGPGTTSLAQYATSFVCCVIILLVLAGGWRWSHGGFSKQDPSVSFTAASGDEFQCRPIAKPEDIQSWSDEQRSWCCVKEKVGCPYKACHGEVPVEQLSEKDRKFCCDMEGLGCASTTVPVAIKPLPFDCMLGPGGATYDWSEEKLEFCCQYSGRGCPTQTSSTATDTTTTHTITYTTAQPTMMVPFPICSPEDKGCTTIFPTPLPLPTTTTVDPYAAYGTAEGYGATGDASLQAGATADGATGDAATAMAAVQYGIPAGPSGADGAQSAYPDAVAQAPDVAYGSDPGATAGAAYQAPPSDVAGAAYPAPASDAAAAYPLPAPAPVRL